jgi:hypothetical protein
MTITKTARYDERHLRPDEKPRYRYSYWVSGTGSFPFDMLRYDSAWPVDTESAAALHYDRESANDHRRRSIHLESFSPPTIGRWSSFTWSVGNEKLY